jgi:hypothetical protein
MCAAAGAIIIALLHGGGLMDIRGVGDVPFAVFGNELVKMRQVAHKIRTSG